jgi:hypothetical protein
MEVWLSEFGMQTETNLGRVLNVEAPANGYWETVADFPVGLLCRVGR